MGYYQMTPNESYWVAINNHTKPGFDLNHYQKIACQAPEEAYFFAHNIPGADIEYCQEAACKSSIYALLFAQYIPEADIEYCRKACEHDSVWLDSFDKMIIKKAML